MKVKVITYHCWNGDRSKIAIVPNNNVVEIYNAKGSNPEDWLLESRFKPEHGGLISCIDWAPKSNRILTCSQDRNAYVWSPPTEKNPEWTPQIVLLRFDRAATFCCWSPNEAKFAVGGSQKFISICFYDEKNDFWVAKRLKRHDSAILSLAWHPSDLIIASSGCDYRVVANAAVMEPSGDEKKTLVPPFGMVKGCTSTKPFFQEVTPGSWISLIAWSPSGTRLASCLRNSTLRVTHFSEGEEPRTYVTLLTSLPFTTGLFVDEDTFVAAGYDSAPSMLKFKSDGGEDDDGGWDFIKFLDMEPIVKKEKGPQTGAAAAMAMFQRSVTVGSIKPDDEPAIVGHVNSTTKLCFAAFDTTGKPTHISSSGLDGRLLLWRL